MKLMGLLLEIDLPDVETGRKSYGRNTCDLEVNGRGWLRNASSGHDGRDY